MKKDRKNGYARFLFSGFRQAFGKWMAGEGYNTADESQLEGT